MFNKIAISLTVIAVLFGASCSALAQSKEAKTSKKKSIAELVTMAKEGRPAADPGTLEIVREAYAERGARAENSIIGNEIVGTWYCHVPESTAGNAPFDAYQTFGTDGTFVETSSLLGTRTEGPAHGAWERSLRGYLLTFELFAFDPETGESVGRVRVRNFIRFSGRNDFTSYNVVDFIEPDGNLIEGIDSGIFTAARLQVSGI